MCPIVGFVTLAVLMQALIARSADDLNICKLPGAGGKLTPGSLICRLCNAKIISNVQQIICFAFHDSKVILRTCEEASETNKIVTLCYLD